MQNRASFLFLAFLVSAFFIFSCKKTEEAASIFPFTYRFNSPNLAEKDVFVIDTFGRIRRITDTLGTFSRPNQQISDSLNKIINIEFMKSMIASISFFDGEKASVVKAVYDTLTKSVIPVDTIPTKYTLEGNRVLLSAFPQYIIDINFSFLELNFCNEFTFRSAIKARPPVDTIYYRRYSKRVCRFDDPRDVAENVKNDFPGERIDTISIEKVNYIFTRY